jgi:hypothetical protein
MLIYVLSFFVNSRIVREYGLLINCEVSVFTPSVDARNIRISEPNARGFEFLSVSNEENLRCHPTVWLQALLKVNDWRD